MSSRRSKAMIRHTVPVLPAGMSSAARRRLIPAVVVLSLLGVAQAAPVRADSPSTPHPVHMRLIYTGGAFSPVSVVWTTNSAISRVDHGTRIDAGVGVAGPPSSTVSSYGRCYQGFASSYVVKHLRVGHRYTVTIAVGHGAQQRRYTRRLTLTRASLKGTTKHLTCH
jgi:hypothetical protein